MGTYNILLVDDESNILNSLKRTLRKFDLKIYTATSGAEGLEILHQYKHEGFALIITDQRMPGMSGIDMLNAANDFLPDAVKIMLTGHTDMHIAIDAINTGSVDYFLTKPWQDSSLHQVVGRMLERYQLITRNKQLDELVKQQNASLKKLNEGLEQKVQERVQEIELQKNDLDILNQKLQEKNKSLQELYNSLEDNFVSTIQMIVRLSQLRSPELAEHSKTVAIHAMEIAKQLNYSETDTLNIQLSGLLHDVGKLGLSETILTKQPEELSNSEKKHYHDHPGLGATLLSEVERLQPISDIVRSHHEHFDGSGFPAGLSGEEIPIGARIIHICDYGDLSLHKRKWEYSHPATTLRGYLTQMAGRFFDPDICQIYMSILTTEDAYLE